MESILSQYNALLLFSGGSKRGARDALYRGAISKCPMPQKFEAHPKSQYSFAFLPYDSQVYCRIPCKAKTKKDAETEAKNWLTLSYWNEDGSSFVPDPIFWNTLVGPTGEILGSVL